MVWYDNKMKGCDLGELGMDLRINWVMDELMKGVLLGDVIRCYLFYF